MVFSEFLLTWGYLGIFIISVLGTATLFFPLPVDGIIFALGSELNPWVLGIIAGIGMTLGELTAYYAGYIGTTLVKKRRHITKIGKVRNVFQKYGFFTIPLFAFTPLPFDIIGIFCGIIKYDVKKFFIGTLLGKIPRAVILALAGNYTFQALAWFVKSMGWI
jgi:membrane protein YqaA with SNARE-associated domain